MQSLGRKHPARKLDQQRLGEKGYMHTYDWVPSMFIWNYHNTVSQLYPNIKLKVKKKKTGPEASWGKESGPLQLPHPPILAPHISANHIFAGASARGTRLRLPPNPTTALTQYYNKGEVWAGLPNGNSLCIFPESYYTVCTHRRSTQGWQCRFRSQTA